MNCSILVYTEGNSHVVRGVKCDFKRISLGEKSKYLSLGYVSSVKELYKNKKKQSQKES
ncbi:MAG: hypothetical protein K0U08_03350 [Proteobacteria bacterium]|nr:hypothetical protein [Pseudomonadota bacterium]